MRSTLGPATIAILAVAVTVTFAQTRNEAEALRRDVLELSNGIAQQSSPLIQDWLRNSEIVRATREEFESATIKKSFEEFSKTVSKEQLDSITNELRSKSYTDLAVLKVAVDDSNICSVVNCYGIHPSNVKRITDAIVNGRDKHESIRAANINSIIAISGAILAVLSFAMSSWTTVISFRSKKSSSDS